MNTEQFKTSMDKIVETLEGDTPSTDIYAGALERIAAALPNAGGGGGGAIEFVNVTCTYTPGAATGSKFTNAQADKSYDEIAALLESGKMVFARVTYSYQQQVSQTDFNNVTEVATAPVQFKKASNTSFPGSVAAFFRGSGATISVPSAISLQIGQAGGITVSDN